MDQIARRGDDWQEYGGAAPGLGKFEHPLFTADGSERATVPLRKPTTLWFNTGTLCNIGCINCYIESSPTNDRLVYITADEVREFLDQIASRDWPVSEIGLTGGEPFMNPDIIEIIGTSLASGFEVLVLTNAMRPLMRPRVQQGLLSLPPLHRRRLTLRVSLDHYTAPLHDTERGKGAFEKSLHGMDWLRDNGFRMTVAGRTMWDESECDSRAGYAGLFSSRGYDIDPGDPATTVLFPEIDTSVDVPEVTTGCWSILGKRPEDMMCANSRMVVKRRGDSRPKVVACTLLPYDDQFELGETLEEAEVPVALNHPNCAQFCVLGGASCS